MLVGHSRQHDHGKAGHVLLQPAHPLQLLQLRGVGQAQIQQDAGRAGKERLRLSQGSRPAQGDRGCHVQQQLFDQQGVGVIVLDEQHLHRAGRRHRGRRGLPGILSHHLNLFVVS